MLSSSKTDLPLELLLTIDVNELSKELVKSVSSEVLSEDVLTLEDLDSVNWDEVASHVLSLADPIGQIVEAVVSAIYNMYVTIKGIVDAIYENVMRVWNFLNDIWNALTRDVYETLVWIWSKLTQLFEVVKGVVVEPILDALRWVAENIPRIADLIKGMVDTVWSFITQIPDAVGGIINQIINFIYGLAEAVETGFAWFVEQVVKLPNYISSLINQVIDIFNQLVEWVRKGFEWFINAVMNLPDYISSLVRDIQNFFGNLVESVRKGFEWFINQVLNLPNIIGSLISDIGSYFSSLVERIRTGFEWFVSQVLQLPEYIKGFLERAGAVIGSFIEGVRQGLAWIWEQLQKIPEFLGTLIGQASSFIWGLIERVKEGFAWFINQVLNIPNYIKSLVEGLINTVLNIINKVRSGFEWFINEVLRLPERVQALVQGVTNVFQVIYEGITQFIDTVLKLPEYVKQIFLGTDEVAGLIETEYERKLFERYKAIEEKLLEHERVVTSTLDNVSKRLYEVGKAFEGQVNAITNLPPALEERFKPLIDYYRFMYEVQTQPFTWWKEYVIQPQWEIYKAVGDYIIDALKWFAERVLEGFIWLWERAVEGFNFLREKIPEFTRTVAGGLKSVAEGLASFVESLIKGWFTGRSPLIFTDVEKLATDVESVFEGVLSRTEGVGAILWKFGGMLLYPYWRLTLIPFLLRGLARTIGNVELVIEPAVAGTKVIGGSWRVRFGELIDAVVKGFEIFISGFPIGVMWALSSTFLVNLQYLTTARIISYYEGRLDDILAGLFEEERREGAKINMFTRAISEPALMDYVRRRIAFGKYLRSESIEKEALATFRVHLMMYGLPKWYIDFLTKKVYDIFIMFRDRFGASRKLLLSPIFELPTHSEMARMTQRDIFPGVDVMKELGWVRGWNEDLTTMIYLLTFKYPSFTNLWKFYMRALSGMLWFKAPETIRQVFSAEAREINAGVPISPYDIQRALRGGRQVSAFETALNTYFKWLEYSNFSWFTRDTQMYGIRLGEEIYNALGGWTADSWLMIDVSADIPTKIDMRWMSRYGIFLHMADRFEQVGVTFEGYSPMVDAVPTLLDREAKSTIQVDLKWFSKLLQATGLHPAWVPIVTVAENIMVISDEMTLLRTGLLNLFKEGLMNLEGVDKVLAGLFMVSYEVGYWNPVTKVWERGWVNLPVRWLPHERRLLEIRMATDRVLDVYREMYRSVASGIRLLVLKPEEATETVKAWFNKANTHFKSLMREITGSEVELRFDSDYWGLMVEAYQLQQTIESRVRTRYLMQRIAGWLMYRVMAGYLTKEDVERLTNTFKKYAYLSDTEAEFIKKVMEEFLGVVRREYIPTPLTLATFSEYMVIPQEIINKVFELYRVPEEFKDLYIKYISVRPVKTDYKELIRVTRRAFVRGVVSEEFMNLVLEKAKEFGFTNVELEIQGLVIDVMEAIESAREWLPTPATLVTLSEYMVLPTELVLEVLVKRRVPKEWIEIWLRYIRVRPLKSDFRAVLTTGLRALRYGAITVDTFKKLLELAPNYGFTPEEINLIRLRTELELLIAEAREYIPTPMGLATLSEYVPEARALMKEVFEARGVKGVWAEIWSKYIYVRPFINEVRFLLRQVSRLYTYVMIEENEFMKVLNMLTAFGFEEFELQLILRGYLAERIRRAYLYVIGSPRGLVTISRYSDRAMDMAWSRVSKMIDLLPLDQSTKNTLKEMWKSFIYVYQAHPEIRQYATEIINAYATGVLDDYGLEQELNNLRKLGVPELRISLIRRTAMLRRARYEVIYGR